MANTVVGPIKGIVHEFKLNTYGEGENSTKQYSLIAQIEDEAEIDKVREAVTAVVKAHNVIYQQLPRPPVQDAKDSDVELADDGFIVRARYRLDRTHLSPFSLTGNGFVDPEKNDSYERRMQPGRRIKFAVKFGGQAPTMEARTFGDRIVAPKPAGAVYCDIVAIVPLKDQVELKSILDQVDFDIDPDEVLPEEDDILGQGNAPDTKQANDDDPPF